MHFFVRVQRQLDNTLVPQEQAAWTRVPSQVAATRTAHALTSDEMMYRDPLGFPGIRTL